MNSPPGCRKRPRYLAAISKEPVVAGAAYQGIFISVTAESIVAAAAVQGVGQEATVQRVRGIIAGHIFRINVANNDLQIFLERGVVAQVLEVRVIYTE